MLITCREILTIRVRLRLMHNNCREIHVNRWEYLMDRVNHFNFNEVRHHHQIVQWQIDGQQNASVSYYAYHSIRLFTSISRPIWFEANDMGIRTCVVARLIYHIHITCKILYQMKTNKQNELCIAEQPRPVHAHVQFLWNSETVVRSATDRTFMASRGRTNNIVFTWNCKLIAEKSFFYGKMIIKTLHRTKPSLKVYFNRYRCQHIHLGRGTGLDAKRLYAVRCSVCVYCELNRDKKFWLTEITEWGFRSLHKSILVPTSECLSLFSLLFLIWLSANKQHESTNQNWWIIFWLWKSFPLNTSVICMQ